MIQWLTQDVLGSLLDESVFLNESLVWFKHKYILTAHFRHLQVIDKSTFEVSNYFQNNGTVCLKRLWGCFIPDRWQLLSSGQCQRERRF